MHQSHYRNRSNQNFHQQSDIFTNRRHYAHNNRQTNYSYHRSKQLSSQWSMNRTSYDNCDYLNGNQVLKWYTDKSISANFMIHNYVTHAYVSAIISIYDKWIQDDYKLKLSRTFLKSGRENSCWAAEVL